MKVLITGINGFIGVHLSRKLTERGHNVLGLTNRHGGVLNKKLVKRAIYSAEAVVHLAALTSHKDVVDRKFEALEINFLGTKNVLDAFSESKISKKIIYASTGKVYGKIVRLPIGEEHPTNPLNILGKSKLITERLIDFYSDNQKEYIIFRIFNVYGSKQKANFLIPTILSQVNSGKRKITLGNIKEKRDHVYIDDAVDAFVRAIEKKGRKGIFFYNICTGLGSSASDIVRLIGKIKRTKIKIKVNKSLLRRDEMDEEYGSYKGAKKELGWEPKITLEEGLRKLLAKETNAKDLQAVIIAGGKGTRMQSVSTDLPKVLFSLAEKPLLDHLIDHFKKHGINDVIICAGHLSNKIEDYVKKASYGVKIRIFKEVKPLGTAGPLHLVRSSLGNEFFVMFGDIYTTINLKKMLKFHRNKKADITIALHKSDHPHDSTIVKIDKNNKILNIIDKPGDKWTEYDNLTATSLYIMKKNMLKFITKGRASDFAKDVFPKMLKSNKDFFGYVTSEFAKDMGTPERYRNIEEYLSLNSR